MLIQHIKTPEKLYLIWEDGESRRHRVGEMTETSFRYLADDEEFKRARASDFTGYPAFPFDRAENNPVPVFIRRCQPRSRTGFADYLRGFGLDPEQKEVKEMSDFQLLAYTGAMMIGDPFHLAASFEEVSPPFEFVLRIIGFQKDYLVSLNDDECEGERLKVVEEPGNAHDGNAVEVVLEGKTVGCIPEDYCDSFRRWLNDGQLGEVRVFKINSAGKPPYLYAFVSVTDAG